MSTGQRIFYLILILAVLTAVMAFFQLYQICHK